MNRDLQYDFHDSVNGTSAVSPVKPPQRSIEYLFTYFYRTKKHSNGGIFVPIRIDRSSAQRLRIAANKCESRWKNIEFRSSRKLSKRNVGAEWSR